MGTVTERRGITYSAEAADDRGVLRCHVFRQQLAYEDREQYSIAVYNETDGDAQAIASLPQTPDQPYRTIVQTVIGPFSDFSTTVVLDRSDSGMMPEMCITLARGDVHLTLTVPHRQADPAPRQSAREALSQPANPAKGSALSPLPSAVLTTYAPARQPATRHEATSLQMQIVRSAPRSRSSPAITPILLFFAALITIVAWFAFRPQIAGFNLPRSAPAQTAIGFTYRATGLGKAQYTVLGPDGQTIADAPLLLGSGTFAITFPRAPAAQAYLIRLRMSGLLGTSTTEDYVRVAAPPLSAARPVRTRPPVKIGPPRIRSLALDRATIVGGDTLNVYYDVLATSGTIAFVDPASQITYGKSELSAAGRTAFVVPRVGAAQFFTVLVTATRGTETTQSRIGVNVTPLDTRASTSQAAQPATPTAIPTAAPTVAPVAAPAAANNADDFGVGATPIGPPGSTVISAPPTVRSRQTIHVVVRGASAGTQLVLLDGTGSELARSDVAAGTSSTNFTAPTVRVPTRFLLEATNPRTAGSETIVRAIAVMP